ncbi:aromatic ring-hydroxylating dioxygenase subunit alpha [Rivularia sp. PCC 7116]|uniref:aromatic ring-hydroxylating dioxygenase subunit alpha n=1 Tax=Rivularia sp. PCC 7116 TaxID=373994 RepID=UPI00030CCD16|nr:aromatic ring-hydroxylating dioxygenase subunit alpha [Rivularia sp. PCC 7116]
MINDWHVVASSENLVEGKILKVRLLGQDVLLWRNGKEALAWEDRCPHRGASLSKGWIEKDNLVCSYHGLAFNGEGKCSHIPAHPEQIPSKRSKACVKTYHLQERYGMVWVCLGIPQQDVPFLAEWDNPEFYNKIFFDGVLHRSSAPRTLENFIDMNHVPFIHNGTLGNSDYPEQGTYTVELKGDGIHIHEVNTWQVNMDIDSERQGDNDPVNFHVLRPLTACLRRGTESQRMAIFFTVTPTEEEECLVWRWMVFNYEVPHQEFKNFTFAVIEQDIQAIESQKPKRLPLNLADEYHLPSDRSTITYRKWLKQLGATFGTIA